MRFINPYYNNDFFSFFSTLLYRCYEGITEQAAGLYSDEIQLLTILCIAVSGAVIGTFLVLRKMTMVGNALSHTVLIGVVLAYFFRSYFYPTDDYNFASLVPYTFLIALAGLFAAFITTFLIQFFEKNFQLAPDASCGVVFTFLFSLGIILATALTRNADIGTELLMGNSDALLKEDLFLQFRIMCINIAVTLFFYRAFLVTTFDPVYSSLFLKKPALFECLLMAQVAITATSAFRAVGVMLVLSFFITPVLIARRFSDKLNTILFLSIGIGVGETLLGVALSRHFLSIFFLPLSTAALIVVLMTLSYVVVLLTRSRVQLTQ